MSALVRLSRVLRRVARSPGDRHEYVVSLYPEGTVGVRELRRRKEFQVPVAWCYVQGAKAAVREERERERKLVEIGRRSRVARGILALAGGR